IIGSDPVEPDERLFSAGRLLPLDFDVIVPFVTGHDCKPILRRGIDSGNGFQASENLIVKGDVLGGRDVGVVNICGDEENILAVEAGVESDEISEAADEETGPNQEHQRERDLERDDPAAGMEAGTFGVTLDFDAFDCGGQRDARGAEGRQDSEQQSGENCDANGETEHAAIHGKVEKYFGLFGGDETHEQRTTPLREQNSEQRAGGREQDAFGEYLADQPCAGSTQRQPHRDFFLTGGCASQEETGDVGASDEQDERDNDHEHFERPLVIAAKPGKAGSGRSRDERPLEIAALHFGLPVRRKSGGENLRRENGEARIRLFAALAGFLASHNANPPGSALIEIRIVAVDDGFSANWNGYVEAGADVGAEKIGRRDADYGEGVAVELNLRADCARGSAVVLLPESIAQNSDAATSASVIRSGEQPAEQRAYAEHSEIFAAGVDSVHILRFSAVGQVEIMAGPSHNPGKNILVIAQLLPNGIGVGVVDLAALLWGEHSQRDQLFGILYRQHSQHDAIEQTENCSVGADAESEREQSDGSDHGSLAKEARAEAEVLPEGSEPAPSPLIVRGVLNQCGVAEFAAGGCGRLGGRLAAGLAVARGHLQVGLDFCVEILLALVARVKWEFHASLSRLGFRIPEMASEI